MLTFLYEINISLHRYFDDIRFLKIPFFVVAKIINISKTIITIIITQPKCLKF